MKRHMAFLMAISLLFTACASSKDAISDKGNDIAKEETTTFKEDEASFSYAKSKSETVTISADEYGNPGKISVKASLLDIEEGSDYVKDYSTLSNIKNSKGDEEYYPGKDNGLYWENKGTDITYSGESKEKNLPVNVKVSYYLNDKEVTAKEIAGASGNIKIRFDYENKTKEKVNVDGKEIEAEVPFLVISTAVLDSEVFSDVEVKNGKLMDADGNKVAVGMCIPGINESLKLAGFEASKDIKMDDFVEISAYAKDFSLDLTATIITNGLFEDFDTEKLNSIEELSDGIGKLQDASKELVDASAKIYSGAGEFQNYLNQYIDGVGQLESGISAFNDAIGKYDLSSLSATDMAKEINSLIKDTKALAKGYKEIVTYMATLKQALSVIGAINWDNVAKDAENQAIVALENNDTYKTLSKEEQKSLKSSISGSVNLDYYKTTIENQLTAINKATPDFDSINSAMEDLTEVFEDNPDIKDSDLEIDAAAISQLIEQAKAIQENVAKLDQGGKALVAGGESLKSGYSTLLAGLLSYKEGMSRFDSEGMSQLSKLSGEGLINIVRGLKAIKLRDKSYESFSGKTKNCKGSVRFIVETDEIS
ncbi:putative membrane protein [Acetitomaculum ruminis DSM 5522]|uniref:Putative membrane protein n=1 Tax=Acetitomaculum ruminis DSM 5522 TaxID=1120918 RepID=A0A1I0W5G5_9FIRM|nr:hypothetical protein [Acetitomaculum ruminis]SFA83922.1 putative membrane protein [Acetitomaculum ruminis DSM 5522]